jgi:hypothetical protein
MKGDCLKFEMKEMTVAVVVRFIRRLAREGRSGGTDGGITERIDRLADCIRNTPCRNVTEITAALNLLQRTIKRWIRKFRE